MKKIYSLLFAMILSTSALTAQEVFQGEIDFSMKMMGEGVEQMEAFLPTGMAFTVGKKDMIFSMEGGMAAAMMGNILIKGKKGESYMIKDSEKTAYKIKVPKDNNDAEEMKPKVEKQDEMLTICGYECQKYKITAETPRGEVTQYVWVTDKLKFPEMKGGNGAPGAGLASIKMDGVKGLPLKMMSSTMGFTTIITAEKVAPGTPDKKMFKIPKGYKVEEMDPSAMMGGMGGM